MIETRTAHEPLIDVCEAARRLSVTSRFVRRLVDERRIPFHKIGRYVRFDPADVNDFVARGRVDALSERTPSRRPKRPHS